MATKNITKKKIKPGKKINLELTKPKTGRAAVVLTLSEIARIRKINESFGKAGRKIKISEEQALRYKKQEGARRLNEALGAMEGKISGTSNKFDREAFFNFFQYNEENKHAVTEKQKEKFVTAEISEEDLQIIHDAYYDYLNNVITWQEFVNLFNAVMNKYGLSL